VTGPGVSGSLEWLGTRIARTTPWLLADVEDATALIGEDWSPDGVEPNRKMTQMLCDELHAQGLLARPVSEAEVFEEFERIER
jgi:hypothetical protein